MHRTRTTDVIPRNPVRDEANQVKHMSYGDLRTYLGEANPRHGAGAPCEVGKGCWSWAGDRLDPSLRDREEEPVLPLGRDARLR